MRIIKISLLAWSSIFFPSLWGFSSRVFQFPPVHLLSLLLACCWCPLPAPFRLDFSLPTAPLHILSVPASSQSFLAFQLLDYVALWQPLAGLREIIVLLLHYFENLTQLAQSCILFFLTLHFILTMILWGRLYWESVTGPKPHREFNRWVEIWSSVSLVLVLYSNPWVERKKTQLWPDWEL